jgi:PAS domain S-box-containing protein
MAMYEKFEAPDKISGRADPSAHSLLLLSMAEEKLNTLLSDPLTTNKNRELLNETQQIILDLKQELQVSVEAIDDNDEEKSKSVLDALMEYIPEGITIATAPDVNIQMVSKYGQKLTGRSREALEGIPMKEHPEHWQVYYPDGETLVPAERLPLSRATLNGEIIENEELLVKREGEGWITVSCNAGPIRNKASEIVGGVIAWRDITKQKEAEQALQDRIASLTLLSEAAREFVRGGDPLTLLEGIYRRLSAHLKLDVYVHFRVAQNAGKIEQLTLDGLPEQVRKSLEGLDFRKTICGMVSQTRQALVVEDVQASSDPLTAMIRSLGLSAYACHPLIIEDRLVGTLAFGSRSRVHFDPYTLMVIRTICDLVGDAIYRQQVEQALRESENRFRTMADNISQLAWMMRADGTVSWYNQRWLEYTGLSLNEVQGWGWRKAHHPDHVERVVASKRRCLESGEVWEESFPLRGKDGLYRWFLTRAVPILDQNGQIIRWFGTNTDITELKQAEEALRESEIRFRQLADAMPQLVWTANPDGSIDYYNQRANEVQGFHINGDGIPQWNMAIHPEDLEMTEKAWSQAIGSGQTYQVEHRVNLANGSYRWHLSRAIPIQDENGKNIKWYGTTTDIHENKLAGEALANANAALLAMSEKLEERVQERTQELSELQRRIMDGIEAERVQIAHEIHDGPMQDIYALIYRLAGFNPSRPAEQIKNEVSTIQRELLQVNQALRVISQDLLPPTLSQFGLKKSIERHISSIQEADSELRINLDLRQVGKSVSERVDLALYRIYQTSITNVIRHAQANQVEIRYYLDSDHYCLEVRDDGKGFEKPWSWIDLARQGHMGLVSARERALSLGGTLEVQSQPGAGTLVRARIPCA